MERSPFRLEASVASLPSGCRFKLTLRLRQLLVHLLVYNHQWTICWPCACGPVVTDLADVVTAANYADGMTEGSNQAYAVSKQLFSVFWGAGVVDLLQWSDNFCSIST